MLTLRLMSPDRTDWTEGLWKSSLQRTATERGRRLRNGEQMGTKVCVQCVCKWNPELMVVVVLDFDAVALGCVVQVFFFFLFKRLFVRPGTSSSVFNACASEGLTSGGSQQAEGR